MMDDEYNDLLLISVESALDGIGLNTYENIRRKLFEKFEFNFDDSIEYPHALKCVLEEFLDDDSYDNFLKLLDKSLTDTVLNKKINYFINVLKL